LMAEKTRGLPLPYLKAWRIKKFIGQSELADKAGIARATVARAERGDEVVSFANIRKLAKALGISAGDLTNKDPEGEGA
jgi:transcriptional regulator with XRE-family HTH domain